MTFNYVWNETFLLRTRINSFSEGSPPRVRHLAKPRAARSLIGSRCCARKQPLPEQAAIFAEVDQLVDLLRLPDQDNHATWRWSHDSKWWGQSGEACARRNLYRVILGTWGKGGSRQSTAHRSWSVAGGPSAFVAPEMIHPAGRWQVSAKTPGSKQGQDAFRFDRIMRAIPAGRRLDPGIILIIIGLCASLRVPCSPARCGLAAGEAAAILPYERSTLRIE